MQSKVAIFYKTHSGDYEWLKYSLRSIIRFTKGFSETVVVSDQGQGKPPVGSAEKHFYIGPKFAGYLGQQGAKMWADAFTEADAILFGDSDTIFVRSITPDDVMIAGLPVWLFEPYDGMTNPDVLLRREAMSKFLGAPVHHEFMRRHPFVVTRELLADFRRFCMRQHGVPIEDYISNNLYPSEWNMIGCWAYEHRRSAIAWRRPDEMPVFVNQEWSHGGLTDVIRSKMEAMLA